MHVVVRVHDIYPLPDILQHDHEGVLRFYSSTVLDLVTSLTIRRYCIANRCIEQAVDAMQGLRRLDLMRDQMTRRLAKMLDADPHFVLHATVVCIRAMQARY